MCYLRSHRVIDEVWWTPVAVVAVAVDSIANNYIIATNRNEVAAVAASEEYWQGCCAGFGGGGFL